MTWGVGKLLRTLRLKRERSKLQRARNRLRALLRPDPEYRARRLAQFSPERRERYLRNVEGLS